jgi:hypothetical protein
MRSFQVRARGLAAVRLKVGAGDCRLRVASFGVALQNLPEFRTPPDYIQHRTVPATQKDP